MMNQKRNVGSMGFRPQNPEEEKFGGRKRETKESLILLDL